MALTDAADGRILPPHFVFNGAPGGAVEHEVDCYRLGEVATFSVQSNAWFDDRVMHEWIDNLILDGLRVHKKTEIADALVCTGTAVVYVPGG
ncbi:hypothetical protein PHMEG_00035593 [Phytophthora megakarya]|uniref:DDE-1 domain-containing protein n=1 Tax=Phytophthora megakarya TaxID=4795 RepID=A0A225UNN5_9STRA|nr:hypothetical protein PHMEG_00035593 [Phytophthora megakarya]